MQSIKPFKDFQNDKNGATYYLVATESSSNLIIARFSINSIEFKQFLLVKSKCFVQNLQFTFAIFVFFYFKNIMRLCKYLI